ncbi:MAG: class I mannose-6-phosphate isomerase [Firmicutes bacterium]|uniref:Mannose-6-phosphate isomerase n=1 Tax=Candidatus Onthovivens merdipullorum TaxID=2840889 RepID=A0A9D9DHG2_9BACL|nr:class I mannose-6-phosphate isomerase [Candidatus Onthovivens merdipullorum]
MVDISEIIPSIKEYIWGGTNLKKYKDPNNQFKNVSESWELSFLDEGPSLIYDENSKTNLELRKVVSSADLGKDINKFIFNGKIFFPLLIKLIDSNSSLSIQVHPSDEYALKHENSLGKEEMWIILDAKKFSYLYLGLNKDLTKEDFVKSIQNNTILDNLNKVYVKKGDIFLVKPGTIHAIGEGITLLEIQESSFLTYRIYDFNRVDQNGLKRPLHIEKALDVINFNKLNVESITLTNKTHIKRKYFHVLIDTLNNSTKEYLYPNSFVVITIIDGDGIINNKKASKFESYFIKANTKINISSKSKISYVISSI